MAFGESGLSAAGGGSALRKSGLDIVGDIPWGTHICEFYAGKTDLIDTLVPYFKAGLEANEFCLWISSKPLGADEAWEALRKAVRDLDWHFAKGQIEILDYTQWYTVGGKFDADRVLREWSGKLETALQRGFAGLRLTADTFWLEQADWEDFTRYEAALDSNIGPSRMLALCTYAIEKCGIREIVDVASNHQLALIREHNRWEVLQNASRRRAEQALKESEARAAAAARTTGEVARMLAEQRAELQLILDATPACIFYKDSENRFVRVNHAFADCMSLPKAQLEGRSVFDLYPPEQAEAYWRDDKEVMASGRPKLNIEEPMQSPAGERWMRTGKVPCRDAAGNIVGIIGFSADVTDRKEAEQRLAADLDAMTRLQQLGSLFVREGNLEAVLAEIVDAAIAIAGADFGDVQLLDPSSGDLRIGAQRGFPRWWLDYWDSVTKGQGVSGTALERGERVIVANVEQSPVFAGTPALGIQLRAGVCAVQSTPLLSRAGKPLGMFSTHYKTPHQLSERALRLLDLLARQAADIIERAQNEEQIFAAKQLLDAHMENSPLAVIEFDREFRVIRWSSEAERLFGWSAAEVTGRAIAELKWVHEDDVENVKRVSADMLSGARPRNLSINRNYRKDGSVVHCEWYNSAIYDAEGRMTTVLSQVLDITERKRREEHEQLLLREVNHRAKNMLGVVQAIASQTAASGREDFIARFSERIQALAANQDLLVRSQWRGVELGDLVRTQLAHFEGLIGGRIEMAGPPLRIAAEAAQPVAMALHELATNAGKYGALSNAEGKVSIAWDIGSDSTFHLSWSESGGPAVAPPIRRGFGTIVIAELPKAQLDAEVTAEFPPRGISWRLTCPAKNVLEASGVSGRILP